MEGGREKDRWVCFLRSFSQEVGSRGASLRGDSSISMGEEDPVLGPEEGHQLSTGCCTSQQTCQNWGWFLWMLRAIPIGKTSNESLKNFVECFCLFVCFQVAFWVEIFLKYCRGFSPIKMFDMRCSTHCLWKLLICNQELFVSGSVTAPISSHERSYLFSPINALVNIPRRLESRPWKS